MSWNYRVVKRPGADAAYGIFEVYYDAAGRPNGWSAETGVHWGAEEGVEAGVRILNLMRGAFDKPVLVIQPDDSLVEQAGA
jgi:hypothetical protein